MAFVVLYDACVLYPAPLRDLLLRIARTGLVRARWSDRILDECFRNILANRPDLKPESLQRTRELIVQAVPDCIVSDYEEFMPGITLPDPNDVHVVAAAVRAGAQVIVTFNLDDFPSEQLEHYNVEANHPDDFVMHAIDLAPAAIATAVIEQAAALKKPPMSRSDLLDILRAQGLARSVAKLRELFGAD